jgi:hypothetical protein
MFLSHWRPGQRLAPQPGSLLTLLFVTVAASHLWGQPALAQPRPDRGNSTELWFDPTQLPSFTGTVERFLVNPRGEVDALLFREGPQVSFPPDAANELRRSALPGRPLTVWGVRARSAPVITMLAFAPSADATPMVLERFYWRRPPPGVSEGAKRISVTGVVRSPYYAPQGEVIGVIFEDGTVVLLQRDAITSDLTRRLFRTGTRLEAEGTGYQGEAGRAVLADRLGEPGAMQVVPGAGPAAGTASQSPQGNR